MDKDTARGTPGQLVGGTVWVQVVEILTSTGLLKVWDVLKTEAGVWGVRLLL